MGVMSPIAVQSYPADLLEYARRNRVEHHLDPLLATTRTLFTNATETRVFHEEDPECSDLFFIVYEVHAPPNLAEWRERRRQWDERFFDLYPIPRTVAFVMTIFAAPS